MMRPARPVDVVGGVAVALLLVWLVMRVCMALSSLDAGDFVTASATLGVPHATGFPLYTMSGYVASLAPAGALPFRVALLSALATFATILAGLCWVRAERPETSCTVTMALGAALVASSGTLSLHAAVAEVYALHTALSLGALCALARLQQRGDARLALVIALLAGLGVANHAVSRLLVPVLLIATWLATPKAARRNAAIGGLLIGTAAVAAYAYLYVAAQRQPMHNWGDPSTLARLWDHLTGAQIREAYASQMTPTLVGARTSGLAFSRQLVASLGVLLPLGALSLLFGAVRGWAGFRAALVFVAVDCGYAVFINPMGLIDHQNGQLTIWLLGFAALSGGVGLGTAAAERGGDALRSLSSMLPQVAGALVVAMLMPALGTEFDGLARDASAEDHAVASLALADVDALILTTSDTVSASHLYVSVALGARPDVAAVESGIVSSAERAGYILPRLPYALVGESAFNGWLAARNGGYYDRIGEVLRAQIPQRTIYWENANIFHPLPPGVSRQHRWPIATLLPQADRGDECSPIERSYCAGPMPAYAQEAMLAAGGDLVFARTGLAMQWNYRASRRLYEGEVDNALEAFALSHRLAPTRANALTAMAVIWAGRGELDRAVALQLQALTLWPPSSACRRNGIRYAREAGDEELARRLEAGATPSRPMPSGALPSGYTP